jgi:hypothetical protein
MPDMSFSGAVSATYRPAGTPPELESPKTTAKFLATGSQTGGHFGLFQWDTTPGSGGPGAPVHKTFSGPPRERYFLESAEIVRSGRTLTAEERTEFLARHDQFMV